MLILTRKARELIRIGEHITLEVLAPNGSQVRLGIAAPKVIAVHREEVYERIHASRPAAVGSDTA